MIALFDRGSGAPFVVVPGLNGRWEWMTSALEALSHHGRVVSYSLAGEPTSGWPAPRSVTDLIAQLDDVFERHAVGRATLCGVSLGGVIALRYAAARPGRVRGLVLASTPGPSFALNAQQRRFLRHPLLLAPLFAMTSAGRLRAELRAAIPTGIARWQFFWAQVARVVRSPTSPRRMAARAALLLETGTLSECARVACPTLVLTGEPHLDRIVAVASSNEYMSEIAAATAASVEGTGHVAVVTRPSTWADVIAGFGRTVVGTEREVA